MTENLRRRLKLAVDSSIALLKSTWIPRDIYVKNMMTVGLQIESFACCISRNEDSNRVFVRRKIKVSLDFLPFRRWRWPVKNLDAMFSKISSCSCASKHLHKIPLGVVVFCEDENPDIRPFGILRGNALPRHACTWTHILANPLDQASDACIRQSARAVSDTVHFFQQCFLARHVSVSFVTHADFSGVLDL